MADKPGIPEFLSGGGELGKMIREYDWASSPLGPVETWPQSLRTCIRIMLTSRQPIWIGWGRELIKFYNDPYLGIIGGKHPWALGKPASEVWKDIWKDIEPLLRQVMEEDQGTYVESQLLIMERNGYPEETYYTFSYTPIPGDDGKTAGMFCANTDDTDKIISERQLRTLTELGKRLTDCKTNEDVISQTILTLGENPFDFPFAHFRSLDDGKAVLKATSYGPATDSPLPQSISLSITGGVAELIAQAVKDETVQVWHNGADGIHPLPTGAWPVEPADIMFIPIMRPGDRRIFGILELGLNPYRLLDEAYRGFITLIADQMSTSFADVHVLEEERRRAEALAEIDRAKTLFFSNISHEFRTPLTLLLGPVEDALQDPETTEENRGRMDVAYRNALRMQKLVNTLLDFSRIEAGRMDGRFTAVDICSFTRDLVSSFRSAVERAGMELRFECEDIRSEIYVDTDMWEKIVLNLVSNAFKYSNEGSIEVSLEEKDGLLELNVADTGVGIPESEIDKIFDRFHRVDNVKGRSGEGTGIGLAMVKELVRLHEGKITVKSKPGKGSVFTVQIPVGREHLQHHKIENKIAEAKVSKGATAYLQEALKWVPGDEEEQAKQQKDGAKPLVLLADDNADMRDYVGRILRDDFEVITATNGEEAYEKILEYNPALVLSDIMMPKLDGFGLLKKLRAHPAKRQMPLIFLSARAGEEAKVEGLEAGADDYLVKPFSAKELLVRVHNHIRINDVRRETEKEFYQLFLQAPAIINVFKGSDYRFELYHPLNKELFDGKDYTGYPIREALPHLEGQGIYELLDQAYYEEKTVWKFEQPVTLRDVNGVVSEKYFNLVYQPWYNSQGAVQGVLNFAMEVTAQVKARKAIEESEAAFRTLAESLPQLVWEADSTGKAVYFNSRISEFGGVSQDVNGDWDWSGMIHPEDAERTVALWTEAFRDSKIFQAEHRMKMKTGSYRWYLTRALPKLDDYGKASRWFGTATDIHAAKEHEALLEEEVAIRTAELHDLNLVLHRSNSDLQQFAHVASHDLKEPLRKVKIFTARLADDEDTTLSEAAKTYLSKVEAATGRMFDMIEGVLSYSTFNSQEQTTDAVDLNKVMADISNDLELPIMQKEASLRYAHLPVIEGARVLLYQLFYNLINNALKFAEPSRSPVITITSEGFEKDGQAFQRIIVEDNGIGFEQEYSEEIFDTFTRLHSKDLFEGTGLGLSLCKRIAERHGGNIHAVGNPGNGARFTIELPETGAHRTI